MTNLQVQCARVCVVLVIATECGAACVACCAIAGPRLSKGKDTWVVKVRLGVLFFGVNFVLQAC